MIKEKNKKTDKVFNKIKFILEKSQKDRSKRFNMGATINFFDVSLDTDIINIGFDLLKIKTNKEENSIVFSIIQDYLNNINSKPIKLHILENIRIKSFINLIFKENLTEDIIDKIIPMVFSEENTFEKITFDFIKNIIDKKEQNIDKIKDIIFKITTTICNSSITANYASSHQFPRILDCISRLTITKEDYPKLDILFQYFSKSLKYYDNDKSFNAFLKNKIPAKDWNHFNKYKNNEQDLPEKTITNQSETNKNKFETKDNPKLHLIINEDLILQEHPIFSLDRDYSTVIRTIVKHINLQKEDLNLSVCKVLDFENKKTEIYFLSKNEQSINSQTFQNIFTSFINIYAEMLNTKQPITELFLTTTLKALILSNSLNFSKKNNENDLHIEKKFKKL